jgi:thiamine-monophosphate kinase
LEEFYKGIKLACNHYEIDLIGGDTSASINGLTISVTALGTAQASQIVYRSGARKGDLICVTGNLGGAYMGLVLLEEENRKFKEDVSYKPQLEGYQYILERQLKPEARKDLGRLLQARQLKPTSMIDISDGLSSDLIHICEASGTGCRIFADKIPFHPETRKFAERLQISPIVAALSGGEDYELLFTVSPEDLPGIEATDDITVIGRMDDSAEGCLLEFEDKSTVLLEAQGWNAADKWKEL